VLTPAHPKLFLADSRQWSAVKGDKVLRFALAFMSIALAMAEQKPDPSDTRRQVWAIKLTQFVREAPGWTPAEHRETEALAFSPGNNLLAVTLSDALKTHLLLLDAKSPEANIRQFDLSQTCGLDLSWNQRGDMLLLCGTLIRLASRRQDLYRAGLSSADSTVDSPERVLD
jgi:hypothetical protein